MKYDIPTQTPTYKSWAAMWERCLDQTDKNYGGRGIRVTLRWLNYKLFFEDMGERPAGTSLDRINYNKGYFRENCRWATRTAQARNRRGLRLLTVDGVTQCLREWEDVKGLPEGTLRQRIKLGWPKEHLFAPRHSRIRRLALSTTTSSEGTPATAAQIQ